MLRPRPSGQPYALRHVLARSMSVLAPRAREVHELRAEVVPVLVDAVVQFLDMRRLKEAEHLFPAVKG